MFLQFSRFMRSHCRSSLMSKNQTPSFVFSIILQFEETVPSWLLVENDRAQAKRGAIRLLTCMRFFLRHITPISQQKIHTSAKKSFHLYWQSRAIVALHRHRATVVSCLLTAKVVSVVLYQTDSGYIHTPLVSSRRLVSQLAWTTKNH